MLKNGIKGMFLVLLLAAMGAAAPLTAQDATPAGHWEGAIQVPGQGLGINLDFTQDAGVWTGDISIPEQMLEDFALGAVSVEGASVNFAMTGIPGNPSFTGTLSEDGQTISGTFSQGGQTFPFEVTREG